MRGIKTTICAIVAALTFSSCAERNLDYTPAQNRFYNEVKKAERKGANASVPNLQVELYHDGKLYTKDLNVAVEMASGGKREYVSKDLEDHIIVLDKKAKAFVGSVPEKACELYIIGKKDGHKMMLNNGYPLNIQDGKLYTLKINLDKEKDNVQIVTTSLD